MCFKTNNSISFFKQFLFPVSNPLAGKTRPITIIVWRRTVFSFVSFLVQKVQIPQDWFLFGTLDWRWERKKLAVKWTVLLSDDSGFMRLPTRRDENGIEELRCLRLIRFLVYCRNIAMFCDLPNPFLLIVWMALELWEFSFIFLFWTIQVSKLLKDFVKLFILYI